MKKHLTFSGSCLTMFAVCVSSGAAIAQTQRSIDMELNIVAPDDGAVFASGATISYALSLTNNGPDEIKTGDSVFGMLPTGDYLYLTNPGGVVAVGETVPLAENELQLPESETTTTWDLCAQLYDDPSNQITMSGNPIWVSYKDPDPSNNMPCITITVEASTSIANRYESDEKLLLFPNPASNIVHIPVASKTSTKAMIIVRDVLGRVLLKKEFSELQGVNHVDLSIHQLQEGVYVIEKLQNRISSFGKIVINRQS